MASSSMISVLSTEHGRLRREQRDIRKRDVAKAIRYGTRERVWGRRWKIDHDNITFIVNDYMTQEVTAYPSPLATAPIDTRDRVLHQLAKDLFARKPELCTSHTVLVVDNSGSMTSKDIVLHKTRQVAAYSVTAMDYVAEQLFKETATNSDVASLIEFDRNARRVFSRESFDWILYNKLLARRDSRTYIQRQGLSTLDMISGDTNYLLALEEADRALREIDHDRCALSLFFLSDGSPTDSMVLGIPPSAAKSRIEAKMSEMAERYGDKLNVSMVGFGASHHDFSVLEAMTGAVNSANSGAKAEFFYCDKAANKLESAMSSLVSSTTMTRTQLLTGDRNKTRTRRTVQLESSETNGREHWTYFPIQSHQVYNTRVGAFVSSSGLPAGSFVGAGEGFGRNLVNQLQLSPPPFLAINRIAFGTGAERIAYRCNLAVQHSEQSFVLQTMVAKETILVERPDDNVQFHKNFCEAQDLASYLAGEFNKKLVGLPWYNVKTTPQVAFLPCSILTLDDPEWKGRGVLVEKKLNVEKYGWQKYNDNAGRVDGVYHHVPLDIERELQRLDTEDAIIEEGSEEEESDDEVEQTEITLEQEMNDVRKELEGEEGNVKPTDYLQAFSHFTYLFTAKQVLVCDLQGVYNYDLVPSTFELTDPAIHYRSTAGKRNVFGRTDMGEAGMDMFFRTHHCSKLCKLMQLSRRNKKWKAKWRAGPAKSPAMVPRRRPEAPAVAQSNRFERFVRKIFHH